MWILLNAKKFIKNPVGPYRKCLAIHETDNSPKLIFEIRDRIVKRENIKEYLNEPMYGIMVTWISSGGHIHPHTDVGLHNYSHIRYNLPLTLPITGGKTFYNNECIKTKESHYIKCDTSKVHQTSIVNGPIPRICLSFGFLIHD